MQAFEHLRPTSIDELGAMLAATPEARPLAGGMTLIPTLKLRLAAPPALIDLAGVKELQGVTTAADAVTIGATTTHAEVARSSVLHEALPALAALAGGIGDPQVRHRGTIGGSVANADPAADYPAALLALDATVITNRRAIAAADFFVAMFQTALEDGEIVAAVRFPLAAGRAAAYEKFRSPASRYALAGVFVARSAGGVRVAVTGAGPCVFRCAPIEAALNERFAPESLDGLRLNAEGFNSDLHGDAAFRAHLVTVLARRAVQRIAGAEVHR
jgi:aerobic carbon-monoxide dehydrogenase medium subunit